ncbi:hypothetical protein BDQ17DRAFT_1437772 [Cyathus striatus]|nr:hypothetical protein BDQ17DRAFT_1437772 [Cyathus striatus]
MAPRWLFWVDDHHFVTPGVHAFLLSLVLDDVGFPPFAAHHRCYHHDFINPVVNASWMMLFTSVQLAPMLYLISRSPVTTRPFSTRTMFFHP